MDVHSVATMAPLSMPASIHMTVLPMSHGEYLDTGARQSDLR